MKLLILCGQLYPTESNNTKLLSKLLPFLQNGNELQLVAAFKPGKSAANPPQSYCGIPVTWVTAEKRRSLKSLLDSAYSKLMDPNGYSDVILLRRYARAIRALRKRWRYSALLSISEPFPAAAAGTRNVGSVKTAVYFMDPPPSVRGLPDTTFRTRFFRKILKRYDTVVSTPFFREALTVNGFSEFAGKTLCLGFPLVTEDTLRTPYPRCSEKIHLLNVGEYSWI